MFPVIHRECGQVAWQMRRKVHTSDLITASLVVWPDGREAVSGEILICGSCRKSVDMSTLDWSQARAE